METQELEKIKTGLQAFESRIAVATELAERAEKMSLETHTIDEIHEVRMLCVKSRTTTEGEITALRGLVKPITDNISSAGKKIISITEPQEIRLKAIEDEVATEKLRVKQQKEAEEKERIQLMVDQLAKYNAVIDFVVAMGITDAQFEERLTEAKTAFEIEEKRIADELAENERLRMTEEKRIADQIEANRIEGERLEAIRLEQKAAQDKIDAANKLIEQQQKEIQEQKDKAAKEKQDAIDAENKRIQDEADKKQREIEIKERERIAAENAILAQKEKAEKEKIAAEKKLARQPDKVKLETYIIDLDHYISTPIALKSIEALNIMDESNKRLVQIITFLKTETAKI